MAREIIPLSRGSVTERLLSELRESGLPVGDTNTPETPYGWQGDEPNQDDGSFIPWMVLRAGAGQTSVGPLGDSQSSYTLSYVVDYAGVHRVQTDWIADKMRKQLVGIERETVIGTDANWRIQQVRCTGIGGIQRITGSFPDYFIQTDTYEVWVTKERS